MLSLMDFSRPVEAVFPGVQGRVLGVLTRTNQDLTMRAVAELAGVSSQQASVVLGRLAELGVVERRDVPPASLVRLTSGNVAAEAILAIAKLKCTLIDRLIALAGAITPAPASLVVFGSFARGEAGPDSDIDVLVVRPRMEATDEDRWTDTLGHWADQATKAAGNPVNLVEVAVDALPRLLARKGSNLWREASADGIVLIGQPLAELAKAA